MKKSSLKFTVITGASSGIGEATALLLAAQKKALILVARREQKLMKLAQVCLQKGSPEVHVLTCDLLQKESIDDLLFYIREKKIKIDQLINNAGLAQGTDLFQNAHTQDWDVMMSTNVTALLLMTRGLIQNLIANKGHIVNLGSVAGRLVYPGGTVYCATKFAVRAISEGLRMDLKGSAVRVTNIEPGMVNTEFSLVRLKDKKKADAVYEGMTPLKAKDVAETIVWCLSRPLHVNVQELVIYPTDQASVGQVHRR